MLCTSGFVVLTWGDFDCFLQAAKDRRVGLGCTGVYGEPRGGLIPAIGLSHYLGIPLVREPGDNVLWVDDIVDSGRTYRAMRAKFPGAKAIAWASRGDHGVWADKIIMGDSWVIFPWEDVGRVDLDRMLYMEAR